MTLREEARQIFIGMFGPEVAKQVDKFDKPEDYPKDFLDECVFFLGKLIGQESAKKKFLPLYEKYAKDAKLAGGKKDNHSSHGRHGRNLTATIQL